MRKKEKERELRELEGGTYIQEEEEPVKEAPRGNGEPPKSIVLKMPKEIEYVNLTPELWKNNVVALDEREQSVIQKLLPYEENQIKREQFMKIFSEYYEQVKQENDSLEYKRQSLNRK